MKQLLWLIGSFAIGFVFGMFSTMSIVIHEDTKRVLSQTGANVSFSTCGFEGKSWPVRADGMCYMEDRPK